MGQIVFQATLGGQTALVGQNTASSYSLTLPLATDTLVGKATTDTLTNKTLTAPVISSIVNTGTLTLPTSTDTLVGRATTDTLTNKTISGSSNTISNISLTSSVTGTLPVGNGGTGLTTLTSGYIPYGNGTSAFSSSSSLYFDGANLGVGTTSPYSNAAFSTLSLGGSGSARTGLIALVTAAGTDSAHIDVYNTQLRISTNGTTNPIVFYTGGSVTEYMRLTSAGYLGIGTSSPSATLHVVGGNAGDLYVDNNGTQYTEIAIRNGGTSKAQLIWDNTATQLNLVTLGSYPLGFFTNSTEKMRLDSSGNLGLGVTPSAWSGAKVFDIGSRGSLVDWSSSQQTDIWSNGYFNGSSSIYKTTNYASIYRQNNGQHIWYNAPSGTAGNAITFTQAATLDNNGNFMVGVTSTSFRLNATVASGANRDIFAAQISGASNGLTVKWDNASSTLRVNLSSLPTSATGLATGDLYNSGGFLKVA
jgi:hypothetical protein